MSIITAQDHAVRLRGNHGTQDDYIDTIMTIEMVRRGTFLRYLSMLTLGEVTDRAVGQLRSAYREGCGCDPVVVGLVLLPQHLDLGARRPSFEQVRNFVEPVLPTGVTVSTSHGVEYVGADGVTRVRHWWQKPYATWVMIETPMPSF